MPGPHSWRELLDRCIEDAQERERIAHELGVTPITLARWVNGQSNPRPQNLQRLLIVLPRQRELLLELIEKEFPGFSQNLHDVAAGPDQETIPPEFYMRVLHTYAITPKKLLFSLLCNLILQQALEQLDPRRLGMAIIVASCLPPVAGKKVRSLRERMGRGTSPWERQLDHRAIFLGAESLAGHAISSGHLEVNQKLREKQSRFPGYRGPWEESAAAIPIMARSEIAGSLLITSTQPDYFLPLRHVLIERYAELLALAFPPEDFYEPGRIELAILPPYEAQQAYLSRFRQRVIVCMKQSVENQRPITVLQAEQIVWQQIETELLEHPQ